MTGGPMGYDTFNITCNSEDLKRTFYIDTIRYDGMYSSVYINTFWRHEVGTSIVVRVAVWINTLVGPACHSIHVVF